MGNWENKEDGPDCYCGNPTRVMNVGGDEFKLVCLFHTREAGLAFSLPRERPDNFSELTIEQVDALAGE